MYNKSDMILNQFTKMNQTSQYYMLAGKAVCENSCTILKT